MGDDLGEQPWEKRILAQMYHTKSAHSKRLYKISLLLGKPNFLYVQTYVSFSYWKGSHLGQPSQLALAPLASQLQIFSVLYSLHCCTQKTCFPATKHRVENDNSCDYMRNSYVSCAFPSSLLEERGVFFFRKKKQAQKSIKEELLLGALCF